ncbi:MAG: heavy-metal-associated domain-containing protein [Bacteroidetes bacterium]|jgi:copper chaperone|nr:MAG: heavy-metal-associated domain-containing protein [Bacteroidota bacterium]TAE71604.1 MAG: heavy-metal-associated domain-containing protein [Bacteroidota bacterium]TAF93266.1 MAG: heavy-metal-associated domain-containing protein [Bacteroidota bacterium]
MEHAISVENLKCNGCIRTITNSLQKLPGVQRVAVDAGNEMVLVTTAANTPRNLLTRTLKAIGYPEKGGNNLKHTIHSFISCALGTLSETTNTKK